MKRTSDSSRTGLAASLTACRRFLEEDIWSFDATTLPRIRCFFYRMVKFCVIVLRGFIHDKCALQASALTYSTLMSVVPVLALSFSVAKGFRAQDMLIKSLHSGLEGMPEQLNQFVMEIFKLVDQTSFVTLGAVGFVLLFWTVISVLGKVEYTFNDVWGVSQPRSIMRKFTDYISVLVFGPVMIIFSSWINISLSSSWVVRFLEQHLGPFYFLVSIGLTVVGWLGILFAFSFLYSFIPNTRVKFSAAVIGGFCAGVSWLLWQWACVRFQVGVSGYNAIYGAFATLPIALFWIYTNWMIILFGVEICFACQHLDTYVLESRIAQIPFAARRKLAQIVVQAICLAFERGEDFWDAQAFQRRSRVPVRLLGELLDLLEAHHLVAALPENRGYVPARNPRLISPADIDFALAGEENCPLLPMLQKKAELPAFLKRIQAIRAEQEEQLKALNFTELCQLELEEEEKKRVATTGTKTDGTDKPENKTEKET